MTRAGGRCTAPTSGYRPRRPGARTNQRRTMNPRRDARHSSMDAFLDLAETLPRRGLTTGEILLTEGDTRGALFILLNGALRIEKHGTPIAAIVESGACVGELSLLLDVPATADVVASEVSIVAVVDDARQMLAEHPHLALALAQLLAARVQHMTTYLAD